MKPILSRFEAICDPVDQWIVWDNDADLPASFGGEIMHGLTRLAAEQFAKILNELYPPQAIEDGAPLLHLSRH